jgi:hypothetical protein
VWIVARIGVDGSLSADKITSLARDLDSALRKASEAVFRADIVTAEPP